MIDLLVVSHQTRRLLQRLVDTLHAEYQPDIWNLYIVDNGSTDGTEAWLLSCCEDHHSYTGDKYHIAAAWCNANVGYAAACNYMASQTHSEIMGFLNADVWLTTADVVAIQSIFDEDPTIAILGPKQRDEKHFITHAGIVGTNARPQHRGWKQHDPLDRLYRDRIDCVTVSGSAYFVRRTVWDQLTQCPKYQRAANGVGIEAPGAFLPTPLYYEETWCSYHARAHGHRVVYDGAVSIGHTWHGSSPVGSQTHKFRESRELFRGLCILHGISHD